MTIFDKGGKERKNLPPYFLPRKWVFGYICIDQKGEERNVDAELMKNIKREALDFFPALPSRPLKAIDLLKYVASNLPSSTVFAVLLTASMAALIGMFVPFINKEIFHNVIPNGIIQALFPIAALFLGVVIGTAMMEVMRNKLMIRLKDSISISLQHAVMARIISLDTSFFWKYSSGEITTRVTSIRELCSIADHPWSHRHLGVLSGLCVPDLFLCQGADSDLVNAARYPYHPAHHLCNTAAY